MPATTARPTIASAARSGAARPTGADSLIPAKKRRSAKVVATTPYRQEMVRRLGEPGDEVSRRTYRQRWKAETVMAVAKRRRGEALSARLDVTQRAQALLRVSSTTSTASSGSAITREPFDRARRSKCRLGDVEAIGCLD